MTSSSLPSPSSSGVCVCACVCTCVLVCCIVHTLHVHIYVHEWVRVDNIIVLHFNTFDVFLQPHLFRPFFLHPHRVILSLVCLENQLQASQSDMCILCICRSLQTASILLYPLPKVKNSLCLLLHVCPLLVVTNHLNLLLYLLPIFTCLHQLLHPLQVVARLLHLLHLFLLLLVH